MTPSAADLLDPLDPFDRLDRPSGRGRESARRALREALAEPLEDAGRLAVARLTGRALAPVASPAAPESTMAVAPAAEPVRRLQRDVLAREAQGGLERAHRLLRRDDPVLASDPRRPEARLGLIEQLNQTARDLLEGAELRFVPMASGSPLDLEAFVDAALARGAAADPSRIHYRPDVRGAGFAGQRTRETRSLAIVAMASAAGDVLGLLEASSTQVERFGTDDLALVALLADYGAGVLERASKIEKLVFVDAMTGAYNRAYFEIQLADDEMARARRESSSMALCIVDIDDFKLFNSRYGYEGGNQVLVHAAHSLKRGVRPFDTVARWGGEEFAILLTAPVSAHDVGTVTERLRAMVERQEVAIRDLAGVTRRVSVTVSLGVALFPDDRSDAADLWSAANRALIEAKQPPKNRVVFFHALPPE